MPHRNERCRPSRPPPTGPPMLRAEESSPQGLIVVGPVCLNTYNWSGENDARSCSGSAREASSRGHPPGHHRRSARRRACQFTSGCRPVGGLHRIRRIRARRSRQATSRDSFGVGGRLPSTRHVSHRPTESHRRAPRPTAYRRCDRSTSNRVLKIRTEASECEVCHGQLSVEYH